MEKKLYCPKCGRVVASYNARNTMYKAAKCKKCKKMVVLNIPKQEIKLTPLPERMTSSGKTFC